MRGLTWTTMTVCAALIAAVLSAEAAPRKPVRPLETTRLSATAFAAVRAPSPGPARPIGSYAAGCIAGAATLPPEGPGYQVIRLSRNRNHGHPVLIDVLRDLGRRATAARLGTLLIGDMGQPRGGPLPFGHASHMIGLDADIWLRLDLPPMDRAARERLSEIIYVDYERGRTRPEWGDGQANLIRLAAGDSRVERIFVHPAIKRALCEADWSDRSWLRKVRPWWGPRRSHARAPKLPAGRDLLRQTKAHPRRRGLRRSRRLDRRRQSPDRRAFAGGDPRAAPQASGGMPRGSRRSSRHARESRGEPRGRGGGRAPSSALRCGSTRLNMVNAVGNRSRYRASEDGRHDDDRRRKRSEKSGIDPARSICRVVGGV